MKSVVSKIKRHALPKAGFLLDRSPSRHHLFVKDLRKRDKLSKIVEELGDIDFRDNEWVLETDFGRMFLREEGSDVDVYWQIFIKKEYQTVIDSSALNNIEIKTIIDAGGNIGLTTLQFLKHFPEANVFVFEPDIGNYNQLIKNTKHCSERISVVQKAVWSEDTTLYLHDSFRDSREWARNVSTERTTTAVPGVCLNSIIRDYKIESIDILKMDIEGGEADIFKPGSDLSFLSRTKIIAMEIHDEFDCREAINRILFEHGFVLYTSGELTVGINKSYT